MYKKVSTLVYYHIIIIFRFMKLKKKFLKMKWNSRKKRDNKSEEKTFFIHICVLKILNKIFEQKMRLLCWLVSRFKY